LLGRFKLDRFVDTLINYWDYREPQWLQQLNLWGY
jgi:hypothetical protein